jgi:hypothetical protein
MRWDPILKAQVEKVCLRAFNLTFDKMLQRYPRWVAQRVPRHVPAPSILFQALKYVGEVYGNALDAKTGLPLFNKEAWKKWNSVLELARQGYLSDGDGLVLYTKCGQDKYGLDKLKHSRSTSKLEGGAHGDVYRKFGALNG